MRSFFTSVLCLTVAAAVGTMAATSLTCGLGLVRGTDTWCGLGYFWIVAIPMSVAFALVLGTPLHFLFRRLNLRSCWQYALAGIVAALPGWLLLAQPFKSVRWEQAGPYDTLNYLGTGALAAVAFHMLTKHLHQTQDAA